MAGTSQAHVARVTGLTQSTVSRSERGLRPALTIDEAALLAAALGLRLSLKLYPDGSPVRDAAQLRLIDMLRASIGTAWTWHPESPVGDHGDLRAWDVLLAGPAHVGIDAETRLHDLQALQRRIALKVRDSGVAAAVLVIAGTRHNRRVLREHRHTLGETFPLGGGEVMEALRAGKVPAHNGILVL